MKLLELEPAAPVYGGMCLSKKDGIIFVKGALPGERVIAELTESKRDYAIAQTVEILNASSDRVTPRCKDYNLCGGCHYQHISYERQLSIKEEILLDCLVRIGKMKDGEIPLTETIFLNQWNYRNKAQFKISGRSETEIGFYREHSRHLIPIAECYLLNPVINRFLEKLTGARFLRGIKEVQILSGTNTIAFVRGDGVDEPQLDFFLDIGFDGVVTDNGISVGQTFCVLESTTPPYTYTVSPMGFIQSNWAMNSLLIEKMLELLEPLDGKNILDVYGGGGNFAIPLSFSARTVTVIEENRHSVEDGLRNVKLNNVKNVTFKTKSFEKYRSMQKYDVVIIDPPRSGLTNKAMETLKALSPSKIAYVSCNPSTFARDTAKLMDMYALLSVTLFDMFPNTYHAETLSVFELKTDTLRNIKMK
ncbi:class I SAM-dependent RNA methyltransferase [Candidatus Magnetomonas plexicatena]|uniref:class I SAM-dependent RNA methyltransferase n=1 Tax=Candidatus Magnetomonas plexicatena TaxID=2552947 RepID=UPI001C77BA0D|nr:class I SAM-dependent RNA methyltransferase [Nitrospirales bacterium LBB_01]